MFNSPPPQFRPLSGRSPLRASPSPDGGGGKSAEIDSPSPLVQQLLRRASEPAGVIDVFQPQRQYARTEGWAGQHFPLLERITARAHSGDAANDGSTLLLAGRAQAPEPDFASPFSAVNIASNQAPAAEIAPTVQNSPASSALTPAPHYRISRPALPAASSTDGTGASAPAPMAALILSTTANQAVSDVPAFASGMRVARIQRATADDSSRVPSIVQAPSSSNTSTNPPVAMLLPKPVAAATSSTVQSIPFPSAANTPALITPSAATGISRTREPSAPASNPLLKLANPARTIRLDRQASAQPATPLVQHGVSSASEPVNTASPQDPPLFIWRKANTASPAPPAQQRPLLSTSPPTEIARQSAPESDSMPASASPAASAPASAANHADALPDLDKITEHVSRAILRQLAVERERRGMSL